jgi:hypothetical protein
MDDPQLTLEMWEIVLELTKESNSKMNLYEGNKISNTRHLKLLLGTQERI